MAPKRDGASREISMMFVGIDCTSGSRAFTYAALDTDLRLVTLVAAEEDELLSFVDAHKAALLGVNSPSNTNAGVIRKQLGSKPLKSRSPRGAEIREAEHILRTRKISIAATPHTEAQCAAWIQAGFQLYRALERHGFSPYEQGGAARQWIETNSHAAYCALLGRRPLAEPSLEGRLQRALVLFEAGVRIQDPMIFLEEITRHRLLHGLLPTDVVLSSTQLDALAAAYTAWLAHNRPEQVLQLGNSEEGYITLPVPELLEEY